MRQSARPICGSTFGKARASFTVPQAVIDSKNPAESELIKRITSDDPDEHMPPADSGKIASTGASRDTASSGSSEGGKYEQHWAFVAPKRPEVPAVKNQAWVRNPIDAFVLARLEHEGLEPSPLGECKHAAAAVVARFGWAAAHARRTGRIRA